MLLQALHERSSYQVAVAADKGAMMMDAPDARTCLCWELVDSMQPTLAHTRLTGRGASHLAKLSLTTGISAACEPCQKVRQAGLDSSGSNLGIRSIAAAIYHLPARCPELSLD